MRKTRHIELLCALLLAAGGGCDPDPDRLEDDDGEGCGAKCDEPDDDGEQQAEPVLDRATMVEYASDESGERFKLNVNVLRAVHRDIPDGHEITATITAARSDGEDGAGGGPIPYLDAVLTFDAFSYTGYSSELIDSTELAPWSTLRIRFAGAVNDELRIDQVYDFELGKGSGSPQ